MNQIWPIGTEIWFRTDKKVWTDGQKDGRNGRTHGRRQNYIPLTSSGDNKGPNQTEQAGLHLCWSHATKSGVLASKPISKLQSLNFYHKGIGHMIHILNTRIYMYTIFIFHFSQNHLANQIRIRILKLQHCGIKENVCKKNFIFWLQLKTSNIKGQTPIFSILNQLCPGMDSMTPVFKIVVRSLDITYSWCRLLDCYWNYENRWLILPFLVQSCL